MVVRGLNEGGASPLQGTEPAPVVERAGRYVYEIFPTNFIFLPEHRQDELLSRFVLMLNSAPSTIKVVMVKGKRGIELGGGRTAVIEHPTFYIECGEPIDDILESTRFLFQRVEELPVPKVWRERWNHLLLEDGRVARSFTAYDLPATLPVGFLSEVYDIAEVVQFKATPISPEEASSKLEGYKRTLNALISAHASKRRSPPQYLINKREMAEAALQAVSMGSSRLFRFSLTFAVAAQDLAALKEKSSLLRNRLSARLVRIDSPKMVQGDLYEGDGKKLFIDSGTAGAFYPFVAGEVLESGGIFLGINARSGAPVVYNPLVRYNLNVSVIGTSGSGKSFTTKIFITRLLDKHPDMPVYIIDPEGEYGPLMAYLGGEPVRISGDRPLGLDPLSLFDKSEAADVICDSAGLTERKDISRIRDLVMSSKSIGDLHAKLPADLKEKLSSIFGGPEAFIFKGSPMPFVPKMSFDMKGIESKFLKQLISLLIFGKIWNVISKPDAFGLTKSTPRLVVVDEAWLYMEIPSAAGFLEKISRIGRKRNCILIINTQRPADMIEKHAGRTILENSATKILMRQDESSRRIASETFGLSEQETEIVLDLPQGEGLLMTETTHAWVQFTATSEEEYQLFTTKPSETVA